MCTKKKLIKNTMGYVAKKITMASGSSMEIILKNRTANRRNRKSHDTARKAKSMAKATVLVPKVAEFIKVGTDISRANNFNLLQAGYQVIGSIFGADKT
jgi:uncharacterized protein YeeX (DUF496 family)